MPAIPVVPPGRVAEVTNARRPVVRTGPTVATRSISKQYTRASTMHVGSENDVRSPTAPDAMPATPLWLIVAFVQSLQLKTGPVPSARVPVHAPAGTTGSPCSFVAIGLYITLPVSQLATSAATGVPSTRTQPAAVPSRSRAAIPVADSHATNVPLRPAACAVVVQV